ncbi:MAG: hypothetical protein CMJ64_28790 [Planctomycetaceae bacterium]|nr:hypothetical protein [Planctomycetaceae bacterium]
MAIATSLLIEQLDETVVITPSQNLSELVFEQIEQDADQALQLLDGTRAKNAVWDFQHTDYYGSTALSFFVKLWKCVRWWKHGVLQPLRSRARDPSHH